MKIYFFACNPSHKPWNSGQWTRDNGAVWKYLFPRCKPINRTAKPTPDLNSFDPTCVCLDRLVSQAT